MWFDTEEVYYVSDVPIAMMVGHVVLVLIVYAGRGRFGRMIHLQKKGTSMAEEKGNE